MWGSWFDDNDFLLRPLLTDMLTGELRREYEQLDGSTMESSTNDSEVTGD